MNSDLFRRRLRDYLVIAIGLAGLAIYISLRQFWQISYDFDGSLSNVTAAVDSVRTAAGLGADTVSTALRPISDTDIGEVIAHQTNLLFARDYLQRHRIPIVGYEAVITSRNNNNVNFRIGTSTTATRRSPSDKGVFAQVRITINGVVEGVDRPFAVKLSEMDTSSILAKLLPFAPAKFHPETLQWKYDSTAPVPGQYRFRALIATSDYHNVYLTMNAAPLTGGDNERWMISWDRDNIARGKLHEGSSNGVSLQTTALVIGAIIVLAAIITFFLQLRKRTVSLPLAFSVATGVTAYFVISSLGFVSWLGIGPILFISLTMFIFIGFLMGGMPVAGIVALAQQVFPEKFYTMYRLVHRPWTSYYVGRSIMYGFAASMVSACVFPAMFALTHAIGFDTIVIPQILGSSFVQFMQNPAMLGVAVFVFIPCISLGLTMVSPAFAYSYLPEKFRFPVAFIGSALLGGLLNSMQSSAEPSVLFEGALQGCMFFMVFRFSDVLSGITYSVFSSILLFLPLTTEVPALHTVFFAVPLLWLILGIISYSRRPEVIHEEDYKPQFLYRLEDEKRLREELMAAQVVQRRLLPAKMPTYPTLDIAAACLPAFEVGGDYYDFFPLSQSKLGVLIADVSGKGMSAAFYITLAKGVIVSQIQQSLSPADVMRRVNRLLHGTMERGKFISMIYGIIDTETMSFTYAQAGHNPLLVYRAATKNVETGAKRGMALGLDSGDKFDKAMSDHTLTLGKDDALLLYTDGANEAIDVDGEEFGMERLNACLRPANTSAELLEHIVSSLRAFSGKAKQRDDITLVVVKTSVASPFAVLA